MSFFRKDLETLRAEEISEADVRRKMEGYYRDVDLVIREMVENRVPFRTPFAMYYWLNRENIEQMDIYSDDRRQVFVDDGKDVWGLEFREVAEAQKVLKYLINVGHKLKNFDDLKDSVRYRFPGIDFEEVHVMHVPQLEKK